MKKLLFMGTVLALLGLVVCLQAFAPSTAGPVVIISVLTLLYIVLVGLTTFLLYWGQAIIVKIKYGRDGVHAPSFTRSYYFASVIALAPLILLGMSSVGNVSLYNVSLVGIFLLLSCLYIAKMTRQ